MAANEQPPIRFEHEGPALLGVIDTASLMGDDAQGVGDAIIDEMQRVGDGLRAIGIDMSQVSTLNSVALGVLVTVQTTVLRHQVEFCLIGVRDNIRELLDATRLSTVFRMHPDREAFLQDLGA